MAAVVLFIISDRQNSGETITTHISIKAEAIMFIIILVIAGFFRFYEIDKVPAGCFVDEAQNGFDALKIIKGELPVYVGFSTHNAALYLYLIADMFTAFGAGVTQIRGTSALLGFLTVPAVYFLLRRTIGVPAAITGGLILAFMRWHVISAG